MTESAEHKDYHRQLQFRMDGIGVQPQDEELAEEAALFTQSIFNDFF